MTWPPKLFSLTTGHILFRQTPGQLAGTVKKDWAGKWPPPEQLIIVVEKHTDQYKIVNPVDYADREWSWQEFADENNSDIYWFRLSKTAIRPGKKGLAEYVPISAPAGT